MRPRSGRDLPVWAAPSDTAPIIGVLPAHVFVEVYDGHGGVASERRGEAASASRRFVILHVYQAESRSSRAEVPAVFESSIKKDLKFRKNSINS